MATYIAKGVYASEMIDTYGDGICRRYGASEFKITMNGEPGAITSSGDFETSFGKRHSEKATTWSDAVLAHTRLPAGCCV
jgi:hypothetical protein